MPLEEMSSFFNSRIAGYEEHMLQLNEARDYIEIAQLMPSTPGLNLLDLGCGTGLELDEIFKVNPTVRVTGIDLAEKLLEKLSRKHAARKSQIQLVLADYFEYDFGKNIYDIALSVATLHHFSYEEKTGLYKRIYNALKKNGFYIESDYVAPSQEFEDFHFAENKRIRAEQGIKKGFYHYDTPCTVENQIGMLKKSGFRIVEIVLREENGAILIARK
jgi:tRNA (cmo5U34)-methyltransferase